ncbi:MAG: hypothetical protein ACI9G1_002383, partial [Pirellulaceae bacterium]
MAFNRKRSKVRRRRQRLFEDLEKRIVLDSTTTFNEIMFHPLEGSNQTEWVELYNQMSVDMDLSGWQISGGIEYTFPDGTTLGGGEYAVVAADPVALELTTGLNGVFGPFNGSLNNNGETLELINANDRYMDLLTYSDGGRFPVAPDGSGVTLTKLKGHSDAQVPESWTFSEQVGGTPGAVNFESDNSGGPIELLLSDPNDQVRYHVPSSGALGATWTETNFDDSSWTSGNYGVGFDTDADSISAGIQNVAVGKTIIASSGSYQATAGFEVGNVVDGS